MYDKTFMSRFVVATTTIFWGSVVFGVAFYLLYLL